MQATGLSEPERTRRPITTERLGFTDKLVLVAANAVIAEWTMAPLLGVFGGPSNAGITFIGYFARPADAVPFLGIWAFVRSRTRIPATVRSVLLLVVALQLGALAAGAWANGTTTAINEARYGLWFLGGLLCGVSVRNVRGVVQRIATTAVVTSGFIATITVARVGLQTSTGTRPLWSEPAFSMLLITGLCALIGVRNGTRYLLAALLLGVLAQQRTALIAALTGLAASYFWGRRADGRRGRRVILRTVVPTVAAIALALAVSPSLRSSLSDSLGDAIRPDSTAAWRQESSASLLDQFGDLSAAEKAFGRPAGSGYERVVQGIVRTESPHNHYLYTLLNVGALGLLCLLALVGRTACRRFSANQNARAYVLVATGIFALGYQLGAVDGLVIGLAIALTRSEDG